MVEDSSRKKVSSSSGMERWEACWNCWSAVRRMSISRREREERIGPKGEEGGPGVTGLGLG